MKLVKFKDGSYGIRRWNWFSFDYEFIDLIHTSFWWRRESTNFKDCRGTKAECDEVLHYATDKGEPV